MFNVVPEEITNAVMVTESGNVLFASVCARTTAPDINNESRAKRLRAVTMPMLILLPKASTFTSHSQDVPPYFRPLQLRPVVGL